MTAPTDQLTRIARDSQEAITTAVTTWTEAAERYAKNFDVTNPLLTAADAHAAVDTGYDLAAKLLAGQHALATSIVDTAKQAIERFTQGAPLPAFSTAAS